MPVGPGCCAFSGAIACASFVSPVSLSAGDSARPPSDGVRLHAGSRSKDRYAAGQQFQWSTIDHENCMILYIYMSFPSC